VTHPSACPDELELLDLARGATAASRGAVLREHIGDCEACRVTVAELASIAREPPAQAAGETEPARYELLRLLAMGAMGEVFVARDLVLGRDVAIKFLHEDTTTSESLARSRRRVLREAQALASFAHPNVVAVYDQGVLDGRAFLAMEYVRGRTLRQWIEQDRPARPAVTEVLVQAGRGLLAAHDIGLVHRDFKPDNVLVGDDGRARVTDFGLARMARQGDAPTAAPPWASPMASGSNDSAIAGTPAYMAPEQLEGKPADARSDQFAFCVTFYEATHGARPDIDRTLSSDAVTRGTRRATPAERVDAVLARGLSADPSARFASMRELLAALEASATPPKRRLFGGGLLVASGAAAVLLSVVIGAVLVRRGAARRAAALSAAPAGLHAPCTGVHGGCPAPLFCRYPEGNFCGASGDPGVCAWPSDGCNAKSTEVCGCNDVTYKNVCEAHADLASTAYRGACVPCTAGAACADVNAGGVRAPAFCRVDEGASSSPGVPPTGVCWPRPSACAAGGVAVCGLDGLSYENACTARRAGTDVDHAGPCSSDTVGQRVSEGAADAASGLGRLSFGAPDEQGMDARPLVALTKWIDGEKLPVFSIVISRHGVVVYELYTSQITREMAHYMWGVTHAVTSALMGIAIDRHLVSSPETSVAEALPAGVFPSSSDRDRFRAVTVREVLGMSALDAVVSPRDKSEATQERLRQFLASPNRTRFALAQPLLPQPGTSYQYSDVTADLATGILEYASRTTALEFAEGALFGPMEFRNYEWMHQDAAGIDSGSYGLRLRPVDMQKLGILYLGSGLWQGKQLVSSDWALRSFSPWMKTAEGLSSPNYGWAWSTMEFGTVGPGGSTQDGHAWRAHVVTGWKGQRVAVFPERGIVVTMTGLLEPPEDEAAIFRRIVRDFVMPSVDGTGAAPARPEPALRGPLEDALERTRAQPPAPRVRELMQEHRDAIPSIEPRGRPHHALRPL
jgi:CubicO group peptidase (beta-lactamase class C family)/tRNA A-37 threonylcarbamoyl transferase component Bud32